MQRQQYLCRLKITSVKAAFSRLVRQFIPAHVLAKSIAEGVEACETKIFQLEGKITDPREVIAFATAEKRLLN